MKAADLEGQQAIEQARRIYAEMAMSAGEYAKVRANTEAATAAKIVEINRATQEQLKTLQAEAMTARDEGFRAIGLQYEIDLARYEDLVRKKLITEREFQTARENLNAIAGQKIKAENERLGDIQRKNYEGIATAFESAIGTTLTGKFASAGDAARNFAKVLVDGLQKAVVEALILKPIMESIRGTGQGTGLAGVIGSALGFPSTGGQKADWTNGTTVSANAEGGDVRAGQATQINERAGRMPEIFVPSVAGKIMPGERASAGGGSASNATTYVVDARSADAGVEQRIYAALAKIEAARRPAVKDVRGYSARYPTRGR